MRRKRRLDPVAEYLERLKNNRFDSGKEPAWVTAYKTRAGQAVKVPARPPTSPPTPRERLRRTFGRPVPAGSPVPSGANGFRAHLIEGRVGRRSDSAQYTRNRR